MRRFESVHNRLTYAGASIAVLALIVFVFLFIFHALTGAGKAPYAGLVIFLVVPAFLLFGLALVPVGIVLERRRIRRTGAHQIPRFPVIDLNDVQQRTVLLGVAVGGLLLLFLSVFGSYQAYELTDSVAFCGTLCHQVMDPEYTAHQNSPHARVSCVECHVGPGADWYVRSKLSGLYQVYAVLRNIYPRPIPTPIKNLRPAQETCEQCHWPRQFFGGQQKRLVHFLPDESNTRWDIELLIKIGGGTPESGRTEGIHWHMNVRSRVEYLARDEERQDIPYIRVTRHDTGQIVEYRSTENPPTGKELLGTKLRVMDCMDCHNRPTHIYRSPSAAVNLALAAGRIDPSLPYMKRQAVELLAAPYESRDQAFQAIADGIGAFYRESYPKVAQAKRDAIQAAAAEIQSIYRRNLFPRMKVRWDAYVDNVGHLNFPGCFRCHDGQHKGSDGETLERRCDTCHVILTQGREGELESSLAPGGLAFRHPEDIGGAWQELPCNTCHTGAAP
jgi:hypothetical protein